MAKGLNKKIVSSLLGKFIFDFKVQVKKEVEMKKRIYTILVGLMLIMSWTGLGMATERSIQGEPMTVTGTIDFRERSGGYYVLGETPPTVLIIVNQDPKVLEELFKGHQKVTIQGHLSGGADLLFIEKIDGKPYAGPQVSK
jgi:hypothetical protein